MRLSHLFLLLLSLLLLTQCASYSSRISAPRRMFERGDYESAAAKLEALVAENDNQKLLYLMDLGMVYHTAGRYEDAIKAFREAEKLAEIKDYTSLSKEAASILLSDDVKFYKGEDFEKILINVYLAMDYSLSNQWESALVECRKVNHKIDQMRIQGKLPYKRNAFAKYLAGSLFEAQREYNDAFVDYRTLLRWKVDFPFLGTSLLRMADKLRTMQELAEYKKKYPSIKNYRITRKQGEIILLLEQGKSPVKVASEQWRRLPKFKRRYYYSDYANMRVGENLQVRTHSLFNIEETAIRQLDHRIGLILAKKIGGAVLKEVVAWQVEKHTKSKLAGALTSLVLQAMDRADTRSWSTLPAKLQIARITVPSGRHDVVLDMVSGNGQTTPGVKKWDAVEVKPGQRVFLNYQLRE